MNWYGFKVFNNLGKYVYDLRISKGRQWKIKKPNDLAWLANGSIEHFMFLDSKNNPVFEAQAPVNTPEHLKEFKVIPCGSSNSFTCRGIGLVSKTDTGMVANMGIPFRLNYFG